jgi:hypothetical protein
MSKAEESDSPPALKSPRRSFLAAILAGTAVVSAGSAMAAPVNPDATLISLAKEYVRVAEAEKAAWASLSDRATDDEFDAITDITKADNDWLERQGYLIRQMAAATQEGRKWKALCALAITPRNRIGEITTNTTPEKMAWNAVSNLAGVEWRVA